MKRPAVFIIFFQGPVQIVHIYEVLRSGYFFQKYHGHFKLMSIFFTFHHFCEKTYEKTYQCYGLFSKVLSLYARSQNFVIWKGFFKKMTAVSKCQQFIIHFLNFEQHLRQNLWKTYHFFFTCFETSTLFLQLQKISWLAN